MKILIDLSHPAHLYFFKNSISALLETNLKLVVTYLQRGKLPSIVAKELKDNSKYAAERYCQLFYQLYGLETVCLRYFSVFGPNQDPTSQYSAVIPKFIKAIMNDSSPTIYGDGLQSRDFTFVHNNVSANLLTCSSKKASGEVINIACGQSFS
jgi:nucleoside-diphosphate-sugar epimerase